MDSTMVAKIIAFVLYLGFMIYIGLRNASKNNSSSDFFLGGRNVGPWVTALSAEASDSSAWLLMGLPGLCYLGGVKETFWTALGLILGTYLNWLFVAKPLRKCSISFGDSITIPEFFTNRFKDKTHILSVLSVVFIVFFFTIYTASGFVACAKLFNSVFGLPYHAGLAIGLLVILCYTVTGGYTAVCTTDFVQGALIFIAFVLSGSIIVVSLGGPSEAIASVQSFDARALANEFGESIRKSFEANASFKGMSIISALAWGLGYFGMPHIIVRFMGIRSNSEIKKARRIGTVWMVISYIGTFLIGTLGTAYLLKNGVLLGTGSESVVVDGVTQFDYQVVESLPAEGVKGVIYLIANSGSGSNLYDEYLWIGDKFELFGTKELEITEYKGSATVTVADGTGVDAGKKVISVKYNTATLTEDATNGLDLSATTKASLALADSAVQGIESADNSVVVTGSGTTKDLAVSSTIQAGAAAGATALQPADIGEIPDSTINALWATE